MGFWSHRFGPLWLQRRRRPGRRAGRTRIVPLPEEAGYSDSASRIEIRPLNVARASLGELLLDYEDFLRQRGLPQWDTNSAETRALRQLPQRLLANGTNPTNLSDRQRWALYAQWLEHEDPAVRANAIICLIHRANYLLDRQITTLEHKFVEKGGYTERLAAARLAHREGKRLSSPSDPTDRIPRCPRCGALMALRTVRNGPIAGTQFRSCTRCPDCRGAVPA